MITDTQKLRELLEKATPGPWVAAGPSFGASIPKYLNEVLVDDPDSEYDSETVAQSAPGLDEHGSADMEYIAAVNPVSVSALLDEIDRLRAELKRTASMLQSACLVISDPEARAMALQQVRDARALLNPPAPPQGEKD